MFYIYEIECDTPNHRYVGQTKDIDTRLASHRQEPCALTSTVWFTKLHGVKSSRVICIVEPRAEALHIEAEWQIILNQRGYVVGGWQGEAALEEVRQWEFTLSSATLG